MDLLNEMLYDCEFCDCVHIRINSLYIDVIEKWVACHKTIFFSECYRVILIQRINLTRDGGHTITFV